MKVNQGSFNTILDGSKQFIIPVYQRTYSWEREHCQRLWNDIVIMQKNKKPNHFIGAIVNMVESIMPMGIQKFIIMQMQIMLKLGY